MPAPKNKAVKHNPYQSILFQQERIRHRTPKALADEYLVLLTTLYGRRFESGEVRLKEYIDMTMFDVTAEIKLRTKMIHADNQRATQQRKDKERKEQEEAIQELLMVQ
jgi:hypothetical protein